jgi:hypothetical protein
VTAGDEAAAAAGGRAFAAALTFACVALALCMPAGAWAGIYKCTGADGRVHYTSDASHCPNAQEQKLEKKLQRVLDDDSTRRRQARPAAARRGARRGDGLEAMWKAKRPAAEQELQQLEARLVQMDKVIKGCNRGGEWYKTDDAGIRRHISCEELRERLAKLQQERDELRSYLADGLEDECRRAGCQPGWVR